jgi:hypothetical protein
MSVDVGRITKNARERREYLDNLKAQTEAMKSQAESAKRQADSASWQAFNRNSTASKSAAPGSFAGLNLNWSVSSGMLKFLFLFLIIAGIFVFIQTYWMYVVGILAILIPCVIICRQLQRRAANPGLKIFLTILVSILLTLGVFFGIPEIKKASAQTSTSPRSQTSATQTGTFMFVSSDALNIRKGPSIDHDIVGQLNKNTRVQILENSGSWWKIKYGNVEGYVNSTYLRN